MWTSPEFKVYLIREFQRLKEQEQAQIDLNAKQELSKINYHIHTDAINLIPQEIPPAQASRIYANETDVLNLALFGMTVLESAISIPTRKAIYATMRPSTNCLSNMENLNAVFIQDGIPQRERFIRLNRIAIQQDTSIGILDKRARTFEMTVSFCTNPHYSTYPLLTTTRGRRFPFSDPLVQKEIEVTNKNEIYGNRDHT